MKPKLRPAGWCWLGLTVYVINADAFLIYNERAGRTNYYTMSSAFRDAVKHPRKRWPIILAWLALTLHLFDFIIPIKIRQYDPLRMAGSGLSRFVFRPKEVVQELTP